MRGLVFGGILIWVGTAFAAIPTGGFKGAPLSTLLLKEPDSRVLVRLKRRVRAVKIRGFNIQWKRQKTGVIAVASGSAEVRVNLKSIKGHSLWQVQEGKGPVEQYVGEKIELKGASLYIDGAAVPKTIQLVPRTEKTFDVIAELDIEEYLSGVLPEEMPALWPIEALKAQAVASRTYTLYHLEKRKSESFHVESTVLDQVFKYRNNPTGLLRGARRVSRAINETRGWVLRDKSGRLIPAYYHADCGGQTEEPHVVWGNGLRQGTVKDEACPLSPHGRWKREFTWDWLNARLPMNELKRMVALADGGAPDRWVAIELVSRTASGRVREVQFISQKGRVKVVSANQFRRIMGYHRIKSTLFYHRSTESGFLIFGQGHGHGVGMCQYGARFLAGRGLSFKKILKHYYPNARLRWFSSFLTAERED